MIPRAGWVYACPSAGKTTLVELYWAAFGIKVRDLPKEERLILNDKVNHVRPSPKYLDFVQTEAGHAFPVLIDGDWLGYHPDGDPNKWVLDLAGIEALRLVTPRILFLGLSGNYLDVHKLGWDKEMIIRRHHSEIRKRLNSRLLERKNTYGQELHEAMNIFRCDATLQVEGAVPINGNGSPAEVFNRIMSVFFEADPVVMS